MKIIAFLQLYNELEKGHLTRCLTNCAQWADEICIYDDCSTDGSEDIYNLYAPPGNIIRGSLRDFAAEQYHKAALLELALSKEPDWIGWIDGDATLDRALTSDPKTGCFTTVLHQKQTS